MHFSKARLLVNVYEGKYFFNIITLACLMLYPKLQITKVRSFADFCESDRNYNTEKEKVVYSEKLVFLKLFLNFAQGQLCCEVTPSVCMCHNLLKITKIVRYEIYRCIASENYLVSWQESLKGYVQIYCI